MRNRTPLIVLLTGMALICSLFVYQERFEIIRKYRWYFEDEVNEPLEAFSKACLKNVREDNATDKIINLRHCIHINSSYNDDKKNMNVWQDRPAMMRWLNNYVTKAKKNPPPMECFYRARTLNRSLRLLGYDARTVVITNNADNFPDHVMVRVRNPDTKHWEIQDPSYDIRYVAKKDGHTLGMRQLLTYKIDDFEPCNFEGKCGWDLISREKFGISNLRPYFASAYDNRERVLYLSRDFDENRIRNVYGKKMSFCQWKPDYCKRIIRLSPKG